MKKVFSVLFITIFFAILCSCHSSKTVSGGDEMLFANKWYLAEIQGQPFIADNGRYAHLSFVSGQPGKVSGSTGCNSLNGSFEYSAKNVIKFAPFATTRMACPGNTEAKFIEAMGLANNYSIANNQLLLNNGKIVVAKFAAVSAELEKLSGTWDLNYISGPRIAFDGLYPDKKPYLSFDVAQSRISGNTSCNNINSSYTIDGNNVHFNQGVTTMMACEGAGESTFLNMLNKVNKYALTDNKTLNLMIDDVAVMRFAKR